MSMIPLVGVTGGTGGFVKSEQTGASEKQWPLFFAVARIVIRVIPVVVVLVDLWLAGKKAWLVLGGLLLGCRLRFRRPVSVQLPAHAREWPTGLQKAWLFVARRPRVHFSPDWIVEEGPQDNPRAVRARRLKRLWWGALAFVFFLAFMAQMDWWPGGDWLLIREEGETVCEVVNDVEECTLYPSAGGPQWFIDYAYEWRWPWDEYARTRTIRLPGFVIMLRFVLIPVLPWLFWTVLTDLEMVYRIESFWKNYRDVMFKPADVSSVPTPLGTLKAAAPSRQEAAIEALNDQQLPPAQVLTGGAGTTTTRLT